MAETKEKKEENYQPEINIGFVGHVDHGKTTLNEKLSGKWTDTHSEELKRGITIRLGYSDIAFYKCPKCAEPEGYSNKNKCNNCGGDAVLVKKVSFIDAPGHESLMATMLSGATIMDGALLLVAANEDCPQPQTVEHLVALKIAGIKHVVVVQNKIDLVTPEEAKENYNKIKSLLKNTNYPDAPIIPISAQFGINIDLLIDAIIKNIPTPQRDQNADPIMFIARSFDINRPGTKISDLKGGVLGGAVIQGSLKVGDKIEIRPGHVYEEANKRVWKPIITEIVSLNTGSHSVKIVTPGGSVGVLTGLDPSIVNSDKLVGNVVGYPDKLPPVWSSDLRLKVNLLKRVVGAKDKLVVDPIKVGESLMLNVNSAATVGVVTELSKNSFHCVLKLPICAYKDSKVVISRRIGTRYRLIGYGIISEK